MDRELVKEFISLVDVLANTESEGYLVNRQLNLARFKQVRLQLLHEYYLPTGCTCGQANCSC